MQDVKKFKVGDPRTFHYLNQTNCYEVANVDDSREYLETRNAMDVVGINQDEQVCVCVTQNSLKMADIFLNTIFCSLKVCSIGCNISCCSCYTASWKR